MWRGVEDEDGKWRGSDGDRFLEVEEERERAKRGDLYILQIKESEHHDTSVTNRYMQPCWTACTRHKWHAHSA